MDSLSKNSALILGAGPAGLACCLEFSRHGVMTKVLDRENRAGGLCRTLYRNGNYFDIGGHRLFSKVDEINRLWRDVLGQDVLSVKRKSRIYFRNKYYDYPLKLFNVLGNLGLWNTGICFLSYLYALLRKANDESTFEGWVSNRFGKRLYQLFFKTYTEKVWGIPCSQLSSDWAVQRIRGMSLKRAIFDALFQNQSKQVKSFVKTFLYPTFGPGLFCDKLKTMTEDFGAEYFLHTEIENVVHDHRRVIEVTASTGGGEVYSLSAENYVSSIPLTVLVQKMLPKAPEAVLEAARNLRFRNFLVVNVVLNKEFIFDDNWIYVHSPEVKLARIQNYKNWSHYMVRDLKTTTLGLEYFVGETEEFWHWPEEALVEFALKEIEKIGLAKRGDLIEAFVVKVPKVYPIYEGDYQRQISIIKNYLSAFSNLQAIGRCGMFRYDNSDHAMLSGLMAARNVLYGAGHDLWSINTEDEYHEELGPQNKPPITVNV